MRCVAVEGLPSDPLAAAARFHAEITPGLANAAEDLLLVFPPADHTHRGWRLAAVQMLARAAAPRRVNAVSPGVVDTPWWNWLPEEQRRAAFAHFAASTPAGRVGRPEDIAQAVAFLIGNTFMKRTVIECDADLRLVGQPL